MLLVGLEHSPAHRLAHVVEAGERVLVQNRLPEGPVETDAAMISASRTVQCSDAWYHAARDNPTHSQDSCKGPCVHLDQVPHGLALPFKPYRL